ncbi:hypothetical protein LU276_09205 [Moraxella haemolytica]|uniref:hypothetical protein n=1 Tax=Moraxella TaxID=475 RepID=UPI002542D9EA|nr:hypothetical protein [Moraxella sp. ZY171148]WII95161.1 hypothetical protein LU276_09205 [Moraxella sp. ZY171148]
MNMIKMTTAVMLAVVATTGCTSIKDLLSKRDDGSLHYQASQKLPPIKLPANQQTAAFTPLYPTPNQQGDTGFKNAAGKQFELPKPPTQSAQ